MRTAARIPLSILALAAFVLASTAAGAVQQPREHEGGILIRLSAGIGGTTSELEFDSGDKLELDEAGGNHNLAIGGIVTDNLAIHGTLFGWATKDPQLDLNGREIGTYSGTVTMNAVGGGLTWYIMPVNIYLSGSLGFAWLSFKDQNVTVDTGTGGAIDLTIGKEWWVSDRWGLGVALGLQGYGIPADGGENFNGGSVSIRFSATFN
jgi:hypothetical protein